MNKNKKPISLKAHLWLYFVTFAIIIMAMLWILQTFFLSTFYNTMKLNELKKVGNLISDQYDINDENFYEFWFEHSFNSGIFAQLVTDDGKLIPNFDNIPSSRYREKIKPENPKEEFKDNNIFPDKKMPHLKDAPGRFNHNFSYLDLDEFAERIQKSPKQKVSYVVEPDGKRGAYAVYGTYLGEIDGNSVYLSLISPLERTDTTRKVIQTQLLIASIIAILMGFALAYFIARRFSKPVEEMNRGAACLAKGDYSVQFKEGSYREVDELARTLNYATTELSKTEELRRDLISNVSHDLRTPLTIIKSYAELIRDISGENPEKRQKHTGVIIDEANNLSLLVNDMLDLSKIQSGTMVMEPTDFELKNLAEQTLKRFDYYSETQGIVFETHYQSAGHVVGDERRIEQVIYNLVANAVNYTGDDNRIIITITETDNSVRFCVKDTGAGIPEDELDRVWDRYYRASETRKREKMGTGIGLSIVKNILLQHDAEFGVISKEGSGSSFWFELKKSEDFTELT